MSHRGQLSCLNNTVPFHSHTMTPPSSHSPITKMAAPQRSNSQDSNADSIRKRVCKACDRCRLKKSKCDGSHPCSRCKADNAICVFGERKKSHDKVYPKGYVEMLEQQQSQLVAGLQEMYRRLRTAGVWSGDALAEPNGHPLTHDILAALDLLESKHDGSGDLETFEEDPARLQSRLLAEGAAFTHRRGSFSSDSEHSQGHATSASHGTPTFSKPAMFSKDSFDFSAPPTPHSQAHSPAPMPQQHRHSFPAAHPSPLQQSSPLSNDPQFYQPEWAYPESTNPELLLRSKYAMQPPELDHGFGNFGDANTFGTWDEKFDPNMAGVTSFPQQFNPYTNAHRLADGTPAGMTLEPMMDVEFNQFIQVMT